MVKNLPAIAGDAEDAGSIPGLEEPLEKEMATHSSILAWRIPWTEDTHVSQFNGLSRDKSNKTERLNTQMYLKDDPGGGIFPLWVVYVLSRSAVSDSFRPHGL